MLVRRSLACFVLLASCDRIPSAGRSEAPVERKAVGWQAIDRDAMDSPIVARVADVAITVADVERQVRASGQPSREALEEIVRFELLAAEARRQGVKWPSLEEGELRAAVVRRYVEREVERGLAREAVPEAELRAKYDERRAYFVHGRLVEVQVLVWYAPSFDQVSRAKARHAAQAASAYIDGHPDLSDDEFAQLAQRPDWKAPNLASLRRSQSPPGPDAKPFSSTIAAAVHALRARGQTTKAVEDPDGFYIARYLAERPPKNIAFAAARAELLDKYHDVWRKQRFLELTQELARKRGVQIFAHRLAEAPTDEAANAR